MTDHDPSLDPEFRAGDRIRTEIGEFEVQQVLGTGGMGVVYQVVRDERHGGRQFAIKTILPELLSRREVVERFEAEGRVLSKFDHENIVKIDGIFNMLSDPPRPFILMELLQGYTLRYVMEQYEEPFSVNDVCTVAIGVCNALEEIHKHNVVHRDIKPENIFIQKRRKQTRVVLIDFGIMKLVLGSGAGRHTTKFFLGSYSNASPEQLLAMEVTARSDFYSLATSLYEMLTGAPLFPELTDVRDVGRAHVDRRPVPLQERAPKVPKEIAEIVMKALEKDPSARPKDAHAFRQPFTTVRNRILREQAQNAGHSTIERFLMNTVGVERPPVSVSASKGNTLKLPALNPELRDTTAPSDPPCGGTHPDPPAAAVNDPAVPFTAPPEISRALPVSLMIMVGAPSPEPSRAERSDWEPPRGLAAIPIQPPAAPSVAPSTDQTSTRDVTAPKTLPDAPLAKSRGEGRVARPVQRARAPRGLAIAGLAVVAVGGLYVGQALYRSEMSAGVVRQAEPSQSASATKPVPTPNASGPLPSVSGSALEQPALAAVDSGASPVAIAPAQAAPSHAAPHSRNASSRPTGSATPATDVVNLFEDISATPAPSASARKKLPGSGL